MGKPFTPEEKKKFDRIKELVLNTIKIMDNDKKLNLKRYEDMFKVFEAEPDEFRKWDMLTNDALDSAPTLIQLPFEEVRMPQIKKAAEYLGIELENYIYYRQHDKRGIRSKMKVPTGYCNIKRVQQILSKKNHYTFDIDDRSLKTGDVKSESKVSAISEPESYALLSINANYALEELLGPRADNIVSKREMYRRIARDGFCSLESIRTKDRTANTTLNTLNTYLLASGIRSDLINNTMQTEYTINKNLKKI